MTNRPVLVAVLTLLLGCDGPSSFTASVKDDVGPVAGSASGVGGHAGVTGHSGAAGRVATGGIANSGGASGVGGTGGMVNGGSGGMTNSAGASGGGGTGGVAPSTGVSGAAGSVCYPVPHPVFTPGQLASGSSADCPPELGGPNAATGDGGVLTCDHPGLSCLYDRGDEQGCFVCQDSQWMLVCSPNSVSLDLPGCQGSQFLFGPSGFTPTMEPSGLCVEGDQCTGLHACQDGSGIPYACLCAGAWVCYQ
jgi:hypothetical protein